MAERYPGYDVLAKWNSPSFDDPTRSVLSDRLGRVPERSFLSEEAWGLLTRPEDLDGWLVAAGTGWHRDGGQGAQLA